MSISGRSPAAKHAVRVLRVRVKDKHAAWLCAMAREVNFVWNYCNDLQQRVFAQERKFLSGFDLQKFLNGASREGLGVGSAVFQQVAEEFATRRRQNRKLRLAWRKSGGARRSLGWVPFKARSVKYAGGQVFFQGRWVSLWDSWGLDDFGTLRAGNFSEDARGRWFLNVSVDVPEIVGPTRPNALPQLEVGVDLGLKALAAISDGSVIDAPRLYRDLEPALAVAQRARKKGRTRAIHAKISNRRKDFLHKCSTGLVKRASAIFVGNVSASQLAKTRNAKSVLDAGWSSLRTMLRYKCDRAGVWFEEVDEAYSTQTCSRCKSRTGPKGQQGLGIREWTCSSCGVTHGRDVNAARNILAVGHDRLVVGIPCL
jgi:putative transposase